MTDSEKDLDNIFWQSGEYRADPRRQTMTRGTTPRKVGRDETSN